MRFSPHTKGEMMAGQTPPGWYRDAQGTLRWFDGTQWTEHTHQEGAQPQAQVAPTPERPWFKKKRFLIPGALVALMVFGAAVGGPSEETAVVASADAESADTAGAEDAEKSEDAPAEEKKEDKPEKKQKPVVEVEAGTIIAEFEQNELAGDEKYKGKRVKVTGTVEKIDTEFFDSDQYILNIGSGDEFAFLTVNCNDMSSKELASLTVGNQVTAVGEFDDGGDLGVELKKCKLA